MKDLIKNKRTLAELCQFASLAGLVLGTGWLIVYITMQQWSMSLALTLLGVLAFPCWLVARYLCLSVGLLGAQIACTAFIVFFALSFDVPNERVPRTTHLYLLVIALIGYVNLQIQSSKTQLGVLVVTLLAFTFFCSSSMAFPLEPALPEAFLVARAWINSACATLVLCGGLYVMHIEIANSVGSAAELRTALDNQDFELFYQPQVNAQGQVLGAEALLRWKHLKRGYVVPAEFIPVAQKSGLMPGLGSWVIREACRTLAAWQAHADTSHLTLSINVAAEQFAMPGLVEELLEATAREKILPAALKLELTESAFLSDIDRVIDKMHKLIEAGFSIALDDFGTGYSSLSYLRQLPLSQLKIDRSFVSGIDENPRAATLTRNIVQIGHDLSLEVLAEGVENHAQWVAMQSFGCTLFQGFLFAKPMPLDDFLNFVANGQCHTTESRSPCSRFS